MVLVTQQIHDGLRCVAKILADVDRVIELPAMYGIIADFIENDKSFSIMKEEDRRISLDFANYCENQS